MQNSYPGHSNTPYEVTYRFRILGANDANPTLEEGRGAAITRTGEGAYTITWGENPGTFVGFAWGFGAATPADMAGYTCVRDTYASSVLTFVTYNSLFAAADVIANQYLDLHVVFKRTGVQG